MKKLILSLNLLLFIFTIIQSQPTYLNTDFAVETDSFHLSKATLGLGSFNFEQTGAADDFIWDYSELPYGSQTDNKWLSPNDAGYELPWCILNPLPCAFGEFDVLTNLASYNTDSLVIGPFSLKNLVNHYRITNEALEFTMLGGTITGIPAPNEYEIPDTIYKFPLNYLNEDSAESRYVIDLSVITFGTIDIRYVSNTKRVNRVEGWGQLITPYDTFEETLKMRTELQKNDTIYFSDFTLPINDTIIEFKWFDKNYGIPVLKVSGVELLNNFTPASISYIDSVRCIDPTSLFVYNPVVPDYDSVMQESVVAFINLSANADSFYWEFGDGNFSNEFNPVHTYHCPGWYDVKLKVINTSCGDPFLEDSLILPMFIRDTTNSYKSFHEYELCFGDSIFLQGEWQTEGGTYRDTLVSYTGCDSIVVSSVIVKILDLTVDQIGNTLRCNLPGAEYTWLDCNNNYAILPGENDQLYTATVNGNYACEISFEGCTDTTLCYEVIVCDIPETSFEYSPENIYYDSITSEAIVEFINLSSISDSLIWDFGDGTISHEANPVHIYTCPGEKEVNLKAFNLDCEEPYPFDTYTATISIVDTTHRFHHFESLTICLGDSVFFSWCLAKRCRFI
jgi:PKD repeat protein